MLDKLKQRMGQLRDLTQGAASNLLFEKVSEEIQQQRYNICQECPKLYKPTDTCKVCGCFMKVKTWMPNQSCPLKKWDKAI
jgi:rRNA maturation endonuclease Nob1